MESLLKIPSITGVDIELQVAGPGGRSYAFIIDWHIRFLIAATWFLVGTFAYAGALRFVTPDQAGGTGYVYVVSIPSIAIYFLYHPVLEVLTRGQTPGKRMAGVRLVALADGGAPGVAALLIRNVFRLIDGLPGFYAVGLTATLFTRYAVRIGDIAAGTVLVYDERTRRDALDDLQTRPVERLGLKEAQLVRDLLDRWPELGAMQRSKLARQLLDKVGATATSGRRVAAPDARGATGMKRDGDNAASAKWFDYRLPEWRRTAQSLKLIERGRSAPPAAVLQAVRAYPEIARDVAIARRAAPQGPLTKFLERVYLQLHRAIFQPPTALGYDLRRLFEHEAPAAVRELKWHIAAVTLLFSLALGAGAWLVGTYPELASLFASEQMIEHVLKGELWTDGLLNVFPSSLLALRIFTNNIAVSLFTLGLGVFYGLGTFYIIGMNGLSIGAMFAFTSQHGMGGRLFEFTAAHGFVELSVICLAGAVGASLGEALARPGERTRAAAFQAAATRGAKLMAVALAFLVGAGILEGYVSPDPRFSLGVRLAIGLSYWALFIAVLSGALGRWRTRRHRQPAVR